MLSLLPLLLIPLAILGAAFYFLRATISWKEFVALELLAVALVIGGFYWARWGALQSTEHWNGHITKKIEDSVSCCHCRDVCDSRDQKGSCTSSHQDCDHILDNMYGLEVSTGDTIVLDACTQWGPPDAWKDATVGEFAAVAHTYNNYLKADPDTLFIRGADEDLVKQIPKFPEITDHYKVSKIVTDGVAAPKGWQRELEQLNDKLGTYKQIDITFLLTKHSDAHAYALAVENAWLYGPKNALIVVMGIEADKIQWARVVTISRVEELKIELREGLTGLDVHDPRVFYVLRTNVEKLWTRTALAEWEYLATHASPSTGGLILLYLFSILLSLGFVALAHHKDLFGDEGFTLNRRYKRHRF